jgi:hypothetical protein
MNIVPESLSQLQAASAAESSAKPTTESVQKGVVLGRSGIALMDAHPKLALGLIVVVCIAVLTITLAAILLWRRSKGKSTRRSASTTAVSQLGGLRKNRLRDTWSAFVRQLPPSLRDSLADHGHFIVLGASGSGKSTLIGQMIDWQGQSHQFRPSLISDPLLQIYLGQRLIVQEVSAALLQSTTKEVSELLQKLLRGQRRSRPLIVVVVLSASQILDAGPERIRREAQLVAGKLGLLAAETSEAVLLRLCVTGMDHLSGYSELARFVHSERRTASVSLSTQSLGQPTELFSQVQPLISKLLVTQPVTTFDRVIAFLQKAPQQLRPVLDYVAALRDASGTAKSAELDQLLFTSLRPEEQVGNPFLLPQVGSRRQRASRSRLLDRFTLPTHATIAGLVSVLVLGVGVWLLLRHHGQIRQAESLLHQVSQQAMRSERAGSPQLRVMQAETIHRGLLHFKDEMNRVEAAELRLSPLRHVFRAHKERLHRELADALRNIYLIPALQRAVEQRSQKLVLESLAAIYASQQGQLGGVLRGQTAEYSRQLAIPESVLRDCLQLQKTPYREPVLTTLPELRTLLSVEQRQVLANPQHLRNWLQELTRMMERPSLSQSDTARLHQQTEKLRAALTEFGKEQEQMILFQLLEEESPLDMRRLFGKAVETLRPEPYLADNQEALLGLTQLIIESTERYMKGGRSNLLDLLRWLNKERVKLDGHRELFVMNINGERVEFETQKWLDLLLRTRKSDLLGEQPMRSSRTRKKRSSPSPGSVLVRSVHTSPLARVLTESPTFSTESLPVLHRAHYDEQVAPLLRELDKVLAQNGLLSEAEQLALARLVRDDVRRFASKYCQAQMAFLLGYRPMARTESQIKAELLSLLRPDSPLLLRLRTVVENSRLSGLDHPMLEPLRVCLAPLAPLAPLIVPGKDGALTALAPYRTAASSLVSELSGLTAASAGTAAPPTAKPDVTPQGGSQPDGQSSSGPLGKEILSRLSPLAKTALELRNRAGTHRREVEQFLDNAGIMLELRKPFLRPFEAAYGLGKEEIEQVVEKLVREDLVAPLNQLFACFPFSRSARQEASVDQIERLLHPQNGQVWKSLQTTYAGLVEERQGVFRSASSVEGELPLPKLPAELWPLLRRAEHVRALLYQADGSVKTVRLMVRPLPVPLPRISTDLQPSLSFLRVGTSEVIGIHQQPRSVPLLLEWRKQGAASVGLEYTAVDSNRKHTQSMEVVDSVWSMHRLLTRAAISEPQMFYFQLVRESETSRWSLGFAFEPDPFALFHVSAEKRER